MVNLEILTDVQLSVFNLEMNGVETNLSEEFNGIYPSLEFIKLVNNPNIPSKEIIVAARTIFQKFEKFDFILTKKNLRGCDIDKTFQYTFNSKNVKDGIQFFILDHIFYYAEIQDLVLADEILQKQKENSDFDIFQLKMAILEKNTSAADEIVNSSLACSIPVIISKTTIYEDYENIFVKRLNRLKCEIALLKDDFTLAEEIVKLLPTDEAESYVYHGHILLSRNERKAALKSFLKGAKLNPNNWDVFYQLGRVYLEDGELDRGIKCVKKSVLLAAHVENIELLCQYILPGEALVTLKNYREMAMPGVLDEQLPFWFQFRKALSFLQLGSAESIPLFQKLTRKFPTNSVLWECLAEAYVTRGSLNTALKQYQKAAELCLEANDDSQATRLRYRIGQLCLETKDVDTAMNMFEGNERSSEMSLGLAECNLEIARQHAENLLPELSYIYIKKTLNLCRHALEKDGSSPLIWKVFADALMVTRHFKKGNLFLEIPKEFCGNDGTRSKEGCLKLAVSVYLKIARAVPESPFSWSDLSMAYYCLQDDERAVLCSKKSIETLELENKGTKSDIWLNLGVTAFRTDPALSQVIQFVYFVILILFISARIRSIIEV